MHEIRLSFVLLLLLAGLSMPQLVQSSPPSAPEPDSCTGPYPEMELSDETLRDPHTSITGVLTFDAANRTVTITYKGVTSQTPLGIVFIGDLYSPNLTIIRTTGFRNWSVNWSNASGYVSTGSDRPRGQLAENRGDQPSDWLGSTENPPSITFTVNNTVFTTTGDRYFVMQESWAYVPLPITVPKTVNYTVKGDGIAADRVAYLGEYNTYRHANGCESFTLIVSAETDFTASPHHLLFDLSNASTALQVGDRYSTNYVALLPAPETEGVTLGNGMAISDTAYNLSASNPAWLHEYVHMRQRFETSRAMRWFTEASASYYGYNLSIQEGYFSQEEFDRRLYAMMKSPHNSSVLADPATWQSRKTPYVKGTVVLAALDRRIRERTDGDRSLRDVFRRMNQYNGTITYPIFTRIVGDVAGTAMDDWLDTYVKTSEQPQVGERPSMLAAIVYIIVNTTWGKAVVAGILPFLLGIGWGGKAIIGRLRMKSKLAAITSLRTSRSRSIKIALAGLFFVALLGFVVGTLSTSEGSVGYTVTLSLFLLFIGTSVTLPLFILGQAGHTIVRRIREKTDQSIQNIIVSSDIRAVEVVLAVVILLVEVSFGHLLLTQPSGEGAGAIVIWVGLLLTLLSICLAVTVLADGIIASTR